MHGIKSNIKEKSFLLTVAIISAQLAILILPSCYTDPEFEEDLCGNIRRANVSAITQVFFSPFLNGIYADENDTVRIEDFRYNFELEFETLQSSASNFPGQCFALDCEPKFDVQNLSNIQILLRNRFMDLPPGTDISYLFKLADETQLSRFRDYSRMSRFYSLTYHGGINSTGRMETELIVYFKSGEQIKFNSISPHIIN